MCNSIHELISVFDYELSVIFNLFSEFHFKLYSATEDYFYLCDKLEVNYVYTNKKNNSIILLF